MKQISILLLVILCLAGCAPKADESKPETWEVSWTKDLAVRPSGEWFMTWDYSVERTCQIWFSAIDAKTGEWVNAFIGEWIDGKWHTHMIFQNRPGTPTLTRMISSKDNVKYVARGPFKSGCDPIIEEKP